MSAAWVAGAFEHPARHAPELSLAQLHAECARGALADAGLQLTDVDGYFCAADAPGASPLYMADYLNLDLRWIDGTESGGCSYLVHVAHAAAAIASGQCNVALVTLAGKPRSDRAPPGLASSGATGPPDAALEAPYRPTIAGIYGLIAQRYMHQHGATPEQLAWVKVTASLHAQHNPRALLPKPVTVQEVLASPVIADGIRRLDCCVVTDGGGALVLTRPEIARSLGRPLVRVAGSGQAVRTRQGGYADITVTGAVQSGAAAFAQARMQPADVQYASIYDNFTIMVLLQLEDLGFCAKGEAGRFAADGHLLAGSGRLPWNTDGGGLCNNHPGNRGGMTKLVEAVRQLRGEAHPAVQVKDCAVALACGPGKVMGSGHGHATVLLEREG
ncbi:thiolase domain-containing protein [Ramlibacter sp. PS3R-8]|uniref:thiolase domain-containing protein n=1 Tax=Ramlibacter sp. PS3R-8 TaxID=3133437 RepID=UPI0030B5B3C5